MEETNEFDAVAVSDDQLVSWPRVAAVAAMVSFSLPSFITGLEVANGMPAIPAFVTLALGAVILFVIGSIMGGIGAKSRLSSYLLTRIAFGDKGAGFVNICFAISLIGWFGINVNLFGDAVSGLSGQLFGLALPEYLLSIIAAAVMTLTTFAGFRMINRLATWMVPVLAIVTVLLIVFSLSRMTLPEIMAAEREPTLTIGEGVSAIVGAIIVGAIILPDISRFVRHWKGAIGVSFIAYVAVDLLVMGAATLAGVVTGSNDILEIMLEFGLGFGAFIIVIAGSLVLNALNLYSAALSTKATFTKWNQTALVLGLGAVGAIAGMLNLLDYFVTFLFYLSILFVPVAGVIMVDFIAIRRPAYVVESLENNRDFAPLAFISWGLGAALALAMAEGWIPSLSGMSALDAMVVSAVSYLALSWRGRNKVQMLNGEA